MNINPMKWFSRGKAEEQQGDTSTAIVRAGSSLGVFDSTLGGYMPRTVNPYFFEALREALPILDAGIDALVMLDGIIRVRGANDKLVQAIEHDLLDCIPVNDAEAGLQAFYASCGNELYEQGSTISEMAFDAKGRELIGLRVGDSKGIAFSRDANTRALRWWYRPPAPDRNGRGDGSEQVEAVIRNNPTQSVQSLLTSGQYVELDPSRCVYSPLNPEADNPYGVSILRSLPFVATILLKMQNATGQAWDRFGSPPLMVTYNTDNKAVASDATKMENRRNALATALANVMEGKRKGNALDFVNALGKGDTIEVAVIGSDGKPLEIEMPAKHMLEQIVAKFGLAPWVLGLQWSTTERLAENQSQMMLQASRTRFARRRRGLHRIVETWLRGRGLTWRPGDWELYQDLPNISNILAEAQAGFLRAQTEFMRAGAQRDGGSTTSPPSSQPPKDPPPEDDPEPDPAKRAKVNPSPAGGRGQGEGGQKAPGDGEPWAESDPELPRIERDSIAGLLDLWAQFRDRVLVSLELDSSKAAKAPTSWSFDAVAMLTRLAADEAFWLREAGAVGGPLLQSMFDSWVRGLENAADELNVNAVEGSLRDTVRQQLNLHGLDKLRTTTLRAWTDDIRAQLAAGAYDGLPPASVAQQLRARFGAHEYDWERLARSEIAAAQVRGKQDEYRELGVEKYDYVTANDSRVSQICRDNAAGGPYDLGDGPLPMTNSHPNCRCTIQAVIE